MRVASLFLLFLGLSNLASAGDNERTVERFVHAFNQKNIDAMVDLSTSDLHWMYISGQQIATETSTTTDLRKAMSSYFENIPSARSELRSTNESGSFVYALEEAFWTVGDVEKSQCSMAIYEFEEKKIKHVWYFPAHTCPPKTAQ